MANKRTPTSGSTSGSTSGITSGNTVTIINNGVLTSSSVTVGDNDIVIVKPKKKRKPRSKKPLVIEPPKNEVVYFLDVEPVQKLPIPKKWNLIDWFFNLFRKK